MPNDLDRPLPSSYESERVIIGAVLLDNALIAQCVEELTQAHFYNPLSRRIFIAMVTLFNSSHQIDPITIGEELKKEGSIESMGGITTITNYTFGLPYFPNLDEYIRILKDKEMARAIIRVANNFVKVALSEEHPKEELLTLCEDQLYSLSDRGISSGFQSHATLMGQSIERARLISETGDRVIGLPTYFTDLDDMTLGLHRGELIILASRPSMGKTALALNISQNVAFRGAGVVAFFSLEMTSLQLEERIICSEGNFNSHSYRTGRLDEGEWEQVAQIQQTTNQSKLFIDETPAVSVSYMRAKLRRLLHEHRQLDLVVMDYLQLGTGRQSNSREQEVSGISRDLKSLAKEFDVPLLATAQLSRAPETRSGHLPTLSDLRESGGLEQDADAVGFLYREDYYQNDPSAYTNIAQLIVAKQRNGPTGTILLQFNAPSSTFRNLAPSDF